MNWIQHIIPAQLIDALGWTLIHSLWQGATLAVLLALTLILLRRNSSRVRYFVATTALFTLMLATTITFIGIYQSGNNPATQVAPGAAATKNLGKLPLVQQIEVTSGKSLSFFSNYFNQHLPLIVTVWLLGVLVLMLRFLGGFAYLQRLRHHQTSAVSTDWQAKTLAIADSLKIKKMVRLLESVMAKTPMVIGHLKPVILLPLGTIGGLSAKQVESILAHEMAHIARNDYLVNILQSVVEIFLFFNPAMWWMSARVREERENCCDDIALQLTNDHITLVKTLATLEEMRITAPQTAVALAGKKGGLVGRISRIINSPRINATFSEGFVAALLMVGFLFLGSFYVRTKPADLATPTPVKSVAAIISPVATSAKVNDTIRFGKFMIVTRPGKKAMVFRNGKKIKPENYDKYERDFAINDKKIRIGKKGSSPITIAVDPAPAGKGKHSYNYHYDFPAPPVPPSVGSVPAPPVPPAGNFHFRDSRNRTFSWSDNEKRVEIEYGKEWKVRKMKVNGKVVPESEHKKYQKYIDQGKQAFQQGSNYERERRKHERHQRQVERQARLHQRNAERHQRQVQRHNQAKKRHRQGVESHHQATRIVKAIIKEMGKDGIIPENTRNYTLNMKKGEIRINGKKLNKKQYKKYHQFMIDIGGGDINKKGDTWNWSSSHSED